MRCCILLVLAFLNVVWGQCNVCCPTTHACIACGQCPPPSSGTFECEGAIISCSGGDTFQCSCSRTTAFECFALQRYLLNATMTCESKHGAMTMSANGTAGWVEVSSTGTGPYTCGSAAAVIPADYDLATLCRLFQ